MFAFLALTLAGAGVGLASDVGRVVPALWRRRPWAAGLLDAVAVVLVGLVAGAAWFRVTWGERRACLLAGVLAGAALYRALASRAVYPALLHAALAVRGALAGLRRTGTGAAAAWRELGRAARRWRQFFRRLSWFL